MDRKRGIPIIIIAFFTVFFIMPLLASAAGPTISGLTVTPGSTTSTISWTTSATGTSYLFYGTATFANDAATSTFSIATSSMENATSVSFTLTGLTPNTLYDLYAESTSTLGVTTSSPLLFYSAATSSFPTITLSYLNPTTLNANAISYQEADYDPETNQVVFYPYGSIIPPGLSGMLLTYTPVRGGYEDSTNCNEIDFTAPSTGVSPYAFNFGGGFTDGSGPSTSLNNTNPSYAYMPPGPRVIVSGGPTKAQMGEVTVQVNLSKLSSDPQNTQGQTYQYIDLNSIVGDGAGGATINGKVGGYSGIWGNGSAYYAPTGNLTTALPNTDLIRYTPGSSGTYSSSFANPANWDVFDLSQIPVTSGVNSADLGGFQGAAFVYPYVYLIPFYSGRYTPTGNPPETMGSMIVAYNTTMGFHDPAAYSYFDLSTLPGNTTSVGNNGATENSIAGFTGAVVVQNRYLILMPYGADRFLNITNYIALEYDTTLPITDKSAWKSINLATVNPKAGGYQYGWVDKNGFVWFVPTHNFQVTQLPSMPPFIAYNPALPFNQSSSWQTYPNPGYPAGDGVWSSGAASDPNTNTAWLAATLGGQTVGMITQVQENYFPSPPQNVTSTIGNSQVTLSWSAPTSTGGPGITLSGYIVNYKTTASSTWINATTTSPFANSFVISGLTNGISYDFQVAAENVEGTSTFASITGIIPITIPTAPQNATSTPGNGFATISVHT